MHCIILALYAKLKILSYHMQNFIDIFTIEPIKSKSFGKRNDTRNESFLNSLNIWNLQLQGTSAHVLNMNDKENVFVNIPAKIIDYVITLYWCITLGWLAIKLCDDKHQIIWHYQLPSQPIHQLLIVFLSRSFRKRPYATSDEIKIYDDDNCGLYKGNNNRPFLAERSSPSGLRQKAYETRHFIRNYQINYSAIVTYYNGVKWLKANE